MAATTERLTGSYAGRAGAIDPTARLGSVASGVATRGGLDGLEFTLARAICFLAPMNFLRLPQLYFTLCDAVVILFVAALALNRSLPAPRPGPFGLAWGLGAVTVVVSLVLSGIMRGDPERALIVSAQYAQTFLVLPIVLLTRPPEQYVALARAFVLSIVLMCVFGIYLIHFDGQTHTRFVSGNGRMRSFVERTNEAAGLIAVTMPILLTLRAVGAMGGVAFAAALAALGYGLLLTGSNSGFVTFAVGIGLFVALSMNMRAVLAIVAAGIAAGAVLLLGGTRLLPPVFQERVLVALQTGDLSEAGSFEHRLDLAREAVERANATVFPGMGPGQYELFSGFAQPVHNTYLLLWTEGGLPAFLGLLLVLGAALLRGASGWSRGRTRASAAGAIAVVLAFAVSISTMPHIYGRFWIVPVLVALGLAHAARSGLVGGLVGGRDAALR